MNQIFISQIHFVVFSACLILLLRLPYAGLKLREIYIGNKYFPILLLTHALHISNLNNIENIFHSVYSKVVLMLPLSGLVGSLKSKYKFEAISTNYCGRYLQVNKYHVSLNSYGYSSCWKLNLLVICSSFCFSHMYTPPSNHWFNAKCLVIVAGSLLEKQGMNHRLRWNTNKPLVISNLVWSTTNHKRNIFLFYGK